MAELIHSTIGRLLEQIAETYPDQEAVVYPDRNIRYTYAQFNSLCRQTAKGLMRMGLGKGDHVPYGLRISPNGLPFSSPPRKSEPCSLPSIPIIKHTSSITC